MKWPWQKCEHHLCQCDGIKTRQTTLEEFGFEFLHKGQTRLKVALPKPVRSTTGFQNWRNDE